MALIITLRHQSINAYSELMLKNTLWQTGQFAPEPSECLSHSSKQML